MPRYSPPIPTNLLPTQGSIYRSYPVLAQALGQRILSGSSRERQMKRWKEQFDWTRTKDGIIINEVKQELAITPHWHKHMVSPLLYELLQAVAGNGCNATSQYFKELILPTTEAYLRLALINPHWFKLKDGKLDGFAREEQLAFLEKSGDKLYDIFYHLLNGLKNKKLICFEHTYLVSLTPRADDAYASMRIATYEEKDWVKSVKESLLKKMGVYLEKHLQRKGLTKAFYEELSKIYFEKYNDFSVDLRDESAKERDTYVRELKTKVWRIWFAEFAEHDIKEVLKNYSVEASRRMTNLESTRWHTKAFGAGHGIVEMVIPNEYLLADLISMLQENNPDINT